MLGRRRPDTLYDELPDDIQPGDYWKVLDVGTGLPRQEVHAGKLTTGVWMVAAPTGRDINADILVGGDTLPERWYMLGTLTKHTVREHEDGTISIRPGDGSSNSILISRRGGESFHGYIEHGVWSSV